MRHFVRVDISDTHDYRIDKLVLLPILLKNVTSENISCYGDSFLFRNIRHADCILRSGHMHRHS